MTEYDKQGNVVKELTAGNHALALGKSQADKDELNRLGISGLSPAQRAELLSTKSTYDLINRGRKLEQLDPLRIVRLENALTTVLPAEATIAARPRTVNQYDVGRPNNGSAVVQDQVTRTTVGAQPLAYPDLTADARVNETLYDWGKGLVVRSTQDVGGLNITRATEYDEQGRVTKSTQPKSNGTDAGTTVTKYWSATGTGACAGKPEWADQICTTGPAGAITGGGSNPSQLPTSTTEYNREGKPAKVIETANGVTRTTVTEYDAAGRPKTVTVSGGIGDAVPVQTTEYDSVTGKVSKRTSPTGGTITETYDKLGRKVSYTDADNGVTRTEYDRLDRPVKETDSVPSTKTFAYDHAAEPRGLATSMTDSVAGTFGAKYDADGSVSEERLPGGFTMRERTDASGSAFARTYTRDSDGKLLLSDGVVESVHGQWLEHSGAPGEFSSQKYRYDKTGRLVETADTYGQMCIRRVYGFDNNANRTSLRTVSGAPGAACPADGGTTVTSAFDSADRLVDPGYVYDAFGRASAQPDGIANTFYANDLVKSQTTATDRQVWTLDAAHRFRSWTTEAKQEDGTWLNTGKKLNHYDSDEDSPRWIVENETGEVSRNVSSLGGDLGATTSAAGDVQLQLANLHDDVSLVLPLDVAQAPTVSDSDEFGNIRPGLPNQRYGWLGAKQRSAETVTGVTLMGVRLYDPKLGRFLSIDPVEGGSLNNYEYSGADPVNNVDLDGRWWRKAGGLAKKWAGAAARRWAFGYIGNYVYCRVKTGRNIRGCLKWSLTPWYRHLGKWAYKKTRQGFRNLRYAYNKHKNKIRGGRWLPRW
ncbi:RHS repeat-associated core domain-containing protein [Kibdelosporangium philippinense]|uniref:RHS repeat-associated core domain-containing protein n=2 Tax=Kibdelosporangium philippinense TaxID=211113 RepID=UPI0035E83298